MSIKDTFYFYCDDDCHITCSTTADPLWVVDRLQAASKHMAEQADKLLRETMEGLESNRNNFDDEPEF